jgi:UDP-N-acetylmuramate dehydrogenase
MTKSISKSSLSTLLSLRLQHDVSLAPFTTFKIGGKADFFYEAESADDLVRAIMAARTCQIPYFLLGLGANILVGDAGFRGLVIRNKAQHLAVSPDEAQITAESGAVVYPNLIEAAAQHQLSGLEHYVMIPSTVGGALWQNLHFLSPDRSRTMFIEEVLLSAEILTPQNERRTVDKSYFGFGYDESVLHHSGDVVLSATFQLVPEKEATLRQVMDANIAWRTERHPPLTTEPSAGSIFKKYKDMGAGRFIDQCGLKGTRIGGAEISPRHANIIINRGYAEGNPATAADVRTLIALAQRRVEEQFGYKLEPEIGFIGEFTT